MNYKKKYLKYKIKYLHQLYVTQQGGSNLLAGLSGLSAAAIPLFIMLSMNNNGSKSIDISTEQSEIRTLLENKYNNINKYLQLLNKLHKIAASEMNNIPNEPSKEIEEIKNELVEIYNSIINTNDNNTGIHDAEILNHLQTINTTIIELHDKYDRSIKQITRHLTASFKPPK